MPLDIPFLLRREDRTPHRDPVAPPPLPLPPTYRKAPSQSPEIVHNHYYSADERPVRWYRRRRCFWTAVALLVFVVVVSAVVLGVVLRLQLGKSGHGSTASKDGPGGSSTSLGRKGTQDGSSASATLSSTSWETSTMESSSHTTTSSLSTSSSSSSGSESTHTTPPLNETVIGILTSFLATFTGNAPSSSSSATSTTSNLSSQSPISTSTWTSSSTLTSTTAAETTSASFRLSEKSQLASVYVANDRSELHRRLLVWQDDESQLVATEWSAGRRVHYRIRDKLRSRMPEAKHGTPLAMAASDSGVIHVVFLDTQDAIAHLVETAIGDWQTRRVSGDDGPITAARFSLLSASWHRGSENLELLSVAYESSQQKLRLAMTDNTQEESQWHAVDVAALPQPVPGQSDMPCFSVAGDWQPPFGSIDTGGRRILMAVVVEDGLEAWECSIDSWPPSKAKNPCHQVNDTFQDDTGHGITSAPPPRQMSWIPLSADGTEYAFSLVCLVAAGAIDENRIGAGVARKAGPGLDTNMTVRAISTTDEAVLFAASGHDIYIYSLDKDGWTWRAEGSLMAAWASR